MSSDLTYMSGFKNHFSTEAIPGALPKGMNSPQRPPMGLYAEQVNNSAFTATEGENLRSWLYKIHPSVGHSPYKRIDTGMIVSAFDDEYLTPEQLRWDPIETSGTHDYIEGMVTMCGNGSAASRSGGAIHIYNIAKKMERKSYCNADGEMLIVPQSGALHIMTEYGALFIEPGEICVVPRGVRHSVNPAGGKAYGYICENYGRTYRLPGRGPIGANGLANERDFLTPIAKFEESKEEHEIVSKFQGQLFTMTQERSPYDVVAWHGNLAPYKYDLRNFNTMNTVSFDHPDPSIFTVLTSPSGNPGEANFDFVIFPPRWMVGEGTFRPPYFHRNVMSEFMGLVYGIYDAKPASGGFVPGGASLHNCMSAHGPEREAFDEATHAKLKPTYMTHTLAFMFESCYVFRPTKFAIETEHLQKDYLSCWSGLESNFKK